ncbi:MAG: TonB family protein [Gemmatimonadota bacterium]|nr:TonB family protein [Gemmatimonadota bacterium]
MRRTTPIAIIAPVVLFACVRPEPIVPPVTTAPQHVWSPPLAYPPAMVDAGIEGSVLLEAEVDTSGNVVPNTIRVVRSTDVAFEAPAMVLLRESRFTPGRTGSELAQVLVRVPVVFELQSDEAVSAADSAAAVGRLVQAERLARGGRIAEAMSAYRTAQALDPRPARVASFWLPLCWYGALWERAAEVLWTCDHVVAVAPNQGRAREARGIARTLTGDLQGAIDDLTAFATWTMNEEERSERLAWVAALREGRNPFTTDVLASLRGRDRKAFP